MAHLSTSPLDAFITPSSVLNVSQSAVKLHFVCTRHARRRHDFLRLNLFLFGMQLFFFRYFSILIVTLQLLLGLSL